MRREPLVSIHQLHEALTRLQEDLRQLGVRAALIGGLAVTMRAEPRSTVDIDLALAVESDQEVLHLRHDLKAKGYALKSPPYENTRTGRIAMIRLTSPVSQHIKVDLLCDYSGIEREVVAAAEPIDNELGGRLPVATVGHLLALKLLAQRRNRSTDLDDARELARVATAADIEQATNAVALIVRRGYAEGEDLTAKLGQLLADEPGRQG